MDVVGNILGKNFQCEVCEGEGIIHKKGSPHGSVEICSNCKGQGYG